MSARYTKKSYIYLEDGIAFVQDSFVSLSQMDIVDLRNRVEVTQHKRVRLCAHQSTDDSLHEMFIALHRETYIRPHRHIGKAESLHILEGSADAVFFDDLGNIVHVIALGEYASGNTFFYRIGESLYHTLIVRSEYLIFHETTEGPFRRADTIGAPWAPHGDDLVAGREYMRQLAETVSAFSKVPGGERKI